MEILWCVLPVGKGRMLLAMPSKTYGALKNPAFHVFQHEAFDFMISGQNKE